MSRTSHGASAPQRRHHRFASGLQRPACGAEALERRLLLVTFFVNGTAGDDQIVVRVSGGTVFGEVNGVPSSAPDATVTDIVVNALGGNDQVTLFSNSDNPTTVNGGAGNE